MSHKFDVSIHRVYDHDNIVPPDAYRVLVDRLWPRGIKKEALHYDDWCKDVAPSPELRKWYGHQPERFTEFKERYVVELAEEPAASALAGIGAQRAVRPVVLLTAVKLTEISAAAVIAEVLGADHANSGAD